MRRILVVDDDPAVRSILSDALRQEGYCVNCVCNGRQALTVCEQNKPADAVVLDLAMPIMDGLTLVRTLRQQTDWGEVPLLILSGKPHAHEIGVSLGARACISKPFDLVQLLETVERIASTRVDAPETVVKRPQGIRTSQPGTQQQAEW
jgi:CheY-like chemotaxis protein